MSADMSGQANQNEEETRKRKREDKCVPEWLKEVLECPVCLEGIRDSPIFLCEGPIGHSLCKWCYLPLFREKRPCPICKGDLSSKRSNLLEKLVENLPKDCCKNKACDFQHSDEQLLWKHEEDNCNQRKISCGLCDEQIPLSQFADHLRTSHRTPMPANPLPFGGENHLKINFSDLTLKKGMEFQLAFEVEDCEVKQFIFNQTPSADGNCQIFWVAYCGPKDEAKHYKYTIKIKSKECEMTEYLFQAQCYKYTLKVNKVDEKAEYLFEGTRSCVPCDISHQEMRNQQCGILIDKRLIQQAASLGNNVLEYCFKVEKNLCYAE